MFPKPHGFVPNELRLLLPFRLKVESVVPQSATNRELELVTLRILTEFTPFSRLKVESVVPAISHES